MTIRQVDIHPEALAEAEAAVAWYAERSSRAPAAFIEEIDNAIQSILNAPKRSPIFELNFRAHVSAQSFSLFSRIESTVRISHCA